MNTPGPVRRHARRTLTAAGRAALPYAASLAVSAAAAVVVSAWWPVVFTLGGVVFLAADRARMHWGWHRQGGNAAARQRRRTEGPATWAELSAKVFRADGIPVCNVTRGQLR